MLASSRAMLAADETVTPRPAPRSTALGTLLGRDERERAQRAGDRRVVLQADVAVRREQHSLGDGLAGGRGVDAVDVGEVGGDVGALAGRAGERGGRVAERVGVELVGRSDPDGHERRAVAARHDERLAHGPGEAVIRQCRPAEPELAGHGALRRDGEADGVGGAGGGAGNADFDGWFTHGGQVWRLAGRSRRESVGDP